MAVAEIHKDLIEGSIVEEGQNGYTATRVFMVSGFTDGDRASRLAQVLKHKEIPKLKDAYPVSTIKITCESREVVPVNVNCETFRVTCKYGSSPTASNEWKWTLNGATIQRTTDSYYTKPSRDSALETLFADDYKNGYTTQYTLTKLPLLKPTHKSADGKRDFSVECPAVQPQIDKLVPAMVFTASKRFIDGAFSLEKAALWPGKVNDTYILALGTSNAGKLLCTRVSGDQVDASTWDIQIEFQWDDSNWEGVAVYLDPHVRLPIEGATVENGSVVKGKIYKEYPFASDVFGQK